MPVKTKDNSVRELERLRKENAELKQDLSKLRNEPTNSRLFDWRTFGKWVSLVLAGLLFVAASIILYSTLSLIDTNRFMDIVGPLGQKPAVQKAVATKITNALFQRVNTEKLAADVLPQKVDFLAPTIAAQAKVYTENAAENVIKSENFQDFWQSTLRKSHDKLITELREYKGNGTISVNDIYANIKQRIKNPKLQFLQNTQLPSKVGDITVLQVSWLPQVHFVVANIYLFRVLAIALFAVLLVLAIWMSRDRRKAIIQVSIMLAMLSLLMLISIRVARIITLQNVNPQYSEAANEIWNALVQPFALQLVTCIVVALAVTAVAWLGGKSKLAIEIRKKFDDIFAGRFHKALFAKESRLTLWVGAYKGMLMILAGIFFVISLLFIDLNLANLILASVILLVAIIIVELLSADGVNKTKRRDDN